MKKQLALLQMDVTMGRPDVNYAHAVRLLEKALSATTGKPDILVLPETLNTGFCPSQELFALADEDGMHTKTVFGDLAKTHAVNIVAGSVTTKRDGKLFNTTYVFNRSGEVVHTYDKIHTFSPAKEHELYASGQESRLFYLDEIPCASMICYDIRFPELARTLALQGAQLFFVPAEWPTVRLYPWEILTRARAIENQVFLCAVNGCGIVDPNAAKPHHFAGHSVLLNPLGEPIVALEGTEKIAIGTLDFDDLQKIRARMSVFADRRPSAYQVD